MYATTLTIDGVVRAALTNIGVRADIRRDDETAIETPCSIFRIRHSRFGIRRPTPESPIPRIPSLYGRRVRLGFVRRLRDERHFDGVDALRAQIDADVRRAERLFSRISV